MRSSETCTQSPWVGPSYAGWAETFRQASAAIPTLQPRKCAGRLSCSTRRRLRGSLPGRLLQCEGPARNLHEAARLRGHFMPAESPPDSSA